MSTQRGIAFGKCKEEKWRGDFVCMLRKGKVIRKAGRFRTNVLFAPIHALSLAVRTSPRDSTDFFRTAGFGELDSHYRRFVFGASLSHRTKKFGLGQTNFLPEKLG